VWHLDGLPRRQSNAVLPGRTVQLKTEDDGAADSAPHAVDGVRPRAGDAVPVDAASMARDLALPRSTTYRLLQTMMDTGYVTHHSGQQVYDLWGNR
jgi:hypothetical protein